MENTTPQKILLVITKSNWGGAGKYVYDLATSYKERGLDVSVACGGDGELVEKLKASGIPAHTLSSLSRDINIFKDFISLFRLLQIIHNESPTILHLNSSKIGLLGAFAGRALGLKKIIFTAHGWAFNEKRPRYQKHFFHILSYLTVLLSDRTIAVSNKMAEELEAPRFLKRKIRVIHNGITPFKQKDKNSFWKEFNTSELYGVKIVSIGELHTSKGYDLALSYLKTLKDIPWTYHIISDGDERRSIENDIKKYGLEGRVFLYGHIKEASSYLSSFDLFFLPSRTEALGYVVIEAINTDIPVLANNIGGVPEIIKNDPGSLLLNMENRKDTFKKLSEVLRKDHRFNTTKREALRIQFSKEKMVEETLKSYS